MTDNRLIGLPARAALAPASLHLELRDIPPDELRDAFLQETIKRVPASGSRIEIQRTELSVPAGAAPAGLIFHVARCGSTLASQMLKRHGRLVVYSEPLAVNEIIVPPHKWPREDLIGALRAVGSFFARHAGVPYVLKLTSWNTLYCDLLADAFPKTPWALCIRDPVEVCVSLLEHPPGWLKKTGAPNPFPRVVDPTGASRTREDYVARTYAALCDAIGKLDPSRGKLIRYRALPDAVWTVLAPHFGISVAADVQARMSEASRTYSKSPLGGAAAFAPDSDRKRAAASPALLQAVEALARPALMRLEDTLGSQMSQAVPDAP